MSTPVKKITIMEPKNYDPNYIGPHVKRPGKK